MKQVGEKYLVNGKDVFCSFFDLEKNMIRLIDMVYGTCQVCMELGVNY